MNIEEDKKRLLQGGLIDTFKGNSIPSPWFPIYHTIDSDEQDYLHHGALAPLAIIEKCLMESDFDHHVGDGAPSVWTFYEDGESSTSYERFGNRNQIEPLIFHRFFDHKPSASYWELSQEFSLFHNLREDKSANCFYILNHDAEEVAVRHSEHLIEIRTDLLLKYASSKGMALVSYISSHCFSRCTLDDLGFEEGRIDDSGTDYSYAYRLCANSWLDDLGRLSYSDCYGKKFYMPPPPDADEDQPDEVYQEFIIDSDPMGKEISHTCDSRKLSNNFGLNPGSPDYLTPVYFRKEVLAKYYAEPERYEVRDGGVYCSGIWNLRIDNNHDDYVVVWLGDLGRDLREKERNYWIGFNIAPHGRNISETNRTRALGGWFAKPTSPDLSFKLEYKLFGEAFRETVGWDFFKELHEDDQYCQKILHTPLSENRAEFDAQILNLTKLLVDSLNEKSIAKGLTTLEERDAGIAKLEKFFIENEWSDYEAHIAFLRSLQGTRSGSVAHRKGSKHDKSASAQSIKEVGYRNTFNELLNQGIQFLGYLRLNFNIPSQELPAMPKG